MSETSDTPGAPGAFDPVAAIDAWLDESITPADHAALDTWLAADASRVSLLAARARMHRNLAVTLANAELGTRNSKRIDPLRPRQRAGVRAGIPVRPILRIPRYAYPLAAALLIAAAALAIYVFAFHPRPETRDPRRATQPVATVIDSTGTLLVGERIAAAGADISAGDMSLDAGSAEFRLTSGVGVRLTGQTRLRIDGPMSATLDYGSASFDCPHSAAGYTVGLPHGARVVDVGTRFALTVSPDGESRLRVTEGKVDVYDRDAATGSSLVAGRVAVIADGRVKHIVHDRVVFQIDFNGTANPQDNRGDASGVIGPAAADHVSTGSAWNTMIHNRTLDGLVDSSGVVWPNVSAATRSRMVGSGDGFALESDPSTLALTGDFLLSGRNDTDRATVTVTGLPGGSYDVYVIAGNVDSTPWSQRDTYRIAIGVGDAPPVVADLGPIGTDPARVARWSQGANYIKRRIVVGDGAPVTITSRGTKRGYDLLNGVQIVSAAPETEENAPNPGTVSPANDKESSR